MVEIGPGSRPLKRFYADVAVAAEAGGFAVLLDGRVAKTPRRAPLAVEAQALAEALAAEWRNAGETIAADDLRLTRLAATAIDLAPEQAEAWRAGVVKFAAFDLVALRALSPAGLVARQNAELAPINDWARRALGAEIALRAGVVAEPQPAHVCDAVAAAAARLWPWRALAVKTAAEITRSAILALALEQDAFPADALFAASRIEEEWQIERWGEDAEAAAATRRLSADFVTAAAFLRLLR